MSKIPPRLTDDPLPPYSYVPGRFPHPLRDPQGHRFGVPPDKVTKLDPQRWQACEAYLRGIDLFNHGYYWEAHESWEAVWNAAGRQGAVADFLKGLIKLAAACVKAREGSANGVARHATRGDKLFCYAQARPGAKSSVMGLSLEDLRGFAQWLEANADEVVDTSDEGVVVIHDFLLEPK